MHQQDPRFLTPPRHPNYYRRAHHHDYTRPARYMITLRTGRMTPALSRISGSPQAPRTELSALGQKVCETIEGLYLTYPQVNVRSYVIMPDHVHLCIAVGWPLSAGLGRVIASLKGESGCDFERGYNDRIAYDDDQWLRQLRYVADNPRRYLIKKLHPDFYYRKWVLTLGENEYMASGNIFLLKMPELQVVRFSRKFAPGVFEKHVEKWNRSIENGGVLVSPFIHPKEAEVGKRALQEGSSVIRICENGFSERFAPYGWEFEHNAEGRLLLIAPVLHQTRAEKLTYGKAISLNHIAEAVASTDWSHEAGRIRLFKK